MRLGIVLEASAGRDTLGVPALGQHTLDDVLFSVNPADHKDAVPLSC